MSRIGILSRLDITQCLVLFVSITLVLAILQALYQAYATPLRDVPGPWLARFTRIWLLHAVNSRSFEKQNIALHRKFGPIVRIAPNEYSIDDFEAAKIIYRSKDELVKSPRYVPFGSPGEEPHLFSVLDIQRHSERKRQVASLYQLSALIKMEHQFDINTIILCKKLSTVAKSGKIIEISDWLRLYALDALGSLAFGKSFGFLEKGGDISGLMTTLHSYMTYGGFVGIFSEWHPFLFRLLQIAFPDGGQGLEYLSRFTRQSIDEIGRERNSFADKKDCEEESLLHSMFAMHQNDPNGFSLEDITYHMIPNVLAGAETVSISLSAAFYYLCKDIEVMNRLRRELDEKRETGRISVPITFKESQDCNYLQAVVKEVLRLHPALGHGLPRVMPKGGMTLAGQFFPEKTLVGVNSWVAHANREVFGHDADAFRPDRWLQDAPSVSKMEQYNFSFGRGPRICIGKNVALMEMSKLIAELILRFDITLVDPTRKWTTRTDWFVRPQDFPVRVSARSESV